MLPYPVGLPFENASIMSRQGQRPRRTHYHQGVDFVSIVDGHSQYGVPGGPIASGSVAEVCYTGSPRCSGYGNGILVRHDDDIYSWYAHLAKIYVAVGDEVLPGDHMYDVGNSFGTPSEPGRTLAVPHLHLELTHAGWPFGARDVAARYDVLSELAAVGLGLSGAQLVADLEPFVYAEPLLALSDVAKSLDVSPAPPEARWKSWPLWVGFGGVVLVGGLIAFSGGSRRSYERGY